MNERIKKLITQAGGHWNHGDFNMPSSVEFQEEDIAKFAALIIEECVDYAFANGDNVDYLKQYFGVE
jgi:hypothetical protein